MKRKTQLPRNFNTHVSDRRNTCVAYDDGYEAYKQGKPMDAPLQGDIFRTWWYEGYLDAKYPEDKYDFKED